MKAKVLKEFLDTKKSKVALDDLPAEKVSLFIDAMIHAEKYVSPGLNENDKVSAREKNTKELVSDEIDLLEKSLVSKKLKVFLENI